MLATGPGFVIYKSLFEFTVNNLVNVLSNPGKVYFEGLVHLLRYIRYNKTLCLNYYADMNDAPVSDLLRQAIINTNNELMDFSDYSWRYCQDTGRSIGA